MGSPEGVGRKNERPQRKVTLSGFYIDQFEVTVGQIAYYLNVTKPKTPCVPYPRKADQMCFGVRPESQFSPLIKDEHGYRPLPGTEKQPFDDANFAAARLYCAWVGKQLPTEAQWEYAARHDPKTGRDLVYPWGDTFEPKRANCKESVCKDGFEWEAPVGTFDGTNGFGDGSSPWGVHDMAGNARDEWTADCYTETPRCPPPCRDPTGARETSDCGRTRKSLGGGRDGEAESLRAAVRSQDATDGRTGFRCVRPLVHPSP